MKKIFQLIAYKYSNASELRQFIAWVVLMFSIMLIWGLIESIHDSYSNYVYKIPAYIKDSDTLVKIDDIAAISKHYYKEGKFTIFLKSGQEVLLNDPDICNNDGGEIQKLSVADWTEILN
jgi:hypothetical protein